MTPSNVHGTTVEMELPSPVATTPSTSLVLTRLLSWCRRLWTACLLAVKIVVVAAFVVQLVILFLDVMLRFINGGYISWTLDFSQLSMAVIAFGGSVLAYEQHEHVGLSFLKQRLSPAWGDHLETLQNLLVLLTSGVLCLYSLVILQQDWSQRSETLGWRETWFVLPFTVGLGLIALRALSRVVVAHWRSTAIGVAVIVVCGVIGVVGRGLFSDGGANGGSVVVVQVGFFAILLVAGLPVSFSLALASLGYLYFAGDYGDPTTVSINMLQGVNSFVLLAIPFFVTVGLLMAESGLGRRMMDCLRILIGRMPGGLHSVVVIASFIFSGLSGAKIADIVAVGVPLKDSLKKAGHPPEDSAALLAASAAGGESVPPSIAMIALGSVASVSISGLFIAGIVPAICIAIGLCAMVYFISRRVKVTRPEWPGWRVAGRSTLIAFPGLLVPLVIIFAVETGIATPTEVSAVAVVICGVFAAIYHEIGWRRLWNLAVRAAALSGVILLLVSAANAFSWSLTAANLAERIASWFTGFSAGPLAFMLISIIALLVMGTLLEGLPAIIVFAPLLFPTAVALGASPLQYGVVVIIGMGVGSFLPPMGVGLYVAASTMGTTFEKAARAMVPYIAVLIAGVVLVALVPEISLALPQLLHINIK